VIRKAIVLLASVSVALLTAATAHAQDTPAVITDDQVDFAADSLAYENEADIVTATGDVRMVRGADRVRADRIIWNRKTGQVRAEGNVMATSAGGDVIYGDTAILTDTLKDGVIDNLLLVLADGGRLAARTSSRTDGVTTLKDAAYSPCPVVDSNNCPRTPSWQISAVKIITTHCAKV
jgi:LPS-assembly protein